MKLVIIIITDVVNVNKYNLLPSFCTLLSLFFVFRFSFFLTKKSKKKNSLLLVLDLCTRKKRDILNFQNRKIHVDDKQFNLIFKKHISTEKKKRKSAFRKKKINI